MVVVVPCRQKRKRCRAIVGCLQSILKVDESCILALAMVLQAAIDIKSDRCSTKNITKSSFQHIFALPATWKPCMNTHTRKPNASLNSLRSGKCFLPLISPSLSLFLSLTLPIPRYPSLTRTCAFPPLSPRSLTRSPPPSLSLSVHPFPAPRISLSLARCSLCLIFSIF